MKNINKNIIIKPPNQSQVQAFYFFGPFDGLEKNDIFVVDCGRLITGYRVYNERYVDVAVMGDDGSTTTENYCTNGDVPNIKLVKKNGREISLNSLFKIPKFESNGLFDINITRDM